MSVKAEKRQRRQELVPSPPVSAWGPVHLRPRSATRWRASGLKALALASSLLFLPGLLLGGTKPSRPNILLIVSDDLGYRDLGCFGSEDARTPHLDGLAREGVRATSFYVTGSACTPSRASLLTGRYPQRNGLYDLIRNDAVDYGHRYTEAEYAISPEMTLGLDLREVTLGNLLQSAHYTCGVVGKWDAGQARRFLPPRRGFDFFYGFASTGIDYWTHARYGVGTMIRGQQPAPEDKGHYATTLFRREALGFVERNKAQPFFLYLAFNAPHVASNLEKDRWQVPASYLQSFPPANTRPNRRAYLAMIACMDEAIGELLDRLKQLGLEDNTLVMFLSDNGGAGPGDNAPLRSGKATLWEGGVRVPFIARWPGRIPAGTVTDAFLSSLELLPTLAAASSARRPRGIVLDGFDMLPVLQGKSRSRRTEMFWEWRAQRAARVGDFKWVEMGESSGLFDLSKDIGETIDLSLTQPATLARVKARFARWKAEMESAEPRGPFRDY